MLRGLFLVTSLFLFSSEAEGQVTCGAQPKIPPDVSQTLKGDIEGRAQLFTKLLGDASLSGRIEESKNQVYQKYSNVDKSTIDLYMAWVSCQNIMTDNNLTSYQKHKLWTDVYRLIMLGGNRSSNEPPRPSDLSVVVKFDDYSFCVIIHTCHEVMVILKNNSDALPMNNVKIYFELETTPVDFTKSFPENLNVPVKRDSVALQPLHGYEVEGFQKESQTDTSGVYRIKQLFPLEDHKVLLITTYTIVAMSLRVSANGFANTWNVKCDVYCKGGPVSAVSEQ